MFPCFDDRMSIKYRDRSEIALFVLVFLLGLGKIRVLYLVNHKEKLTKTVRESDMNQSTNPTS